MEKRCSKLLCLFTVILVLTSSYSLGQEMLSNSRLIKKHQINDSAEDSLREALTFENKSFIAKYNPVTLFGAGALFVYQNVISPQLNSDCLYHPSCSDFAKQSIQRFGFIKGIGLGADRLTRCSGLAEDEIGRHKLNKTGNYLDLPLRYE